MKKYILFLIGIICGFAGYSQADTGKNNTVQYDSTDLFKTLTNPRNKVVFGVASFYSKRLEGSQTSTGEKFSHNNLTAASNDFKLGTWVKVTNLNNNKFVVVRINDRMHKRMQKKGRVVDLSINAAQQLDFIQQGITNVKVESIDSLLKK